MNQSLVADLGDVLVAVSETGLFVSLCSINEATAPVVPDAAGQLDLTNYSPVTGLQNIPCMRAPISDVRFRSDYETRTPAVIADENIWHVLLNGHYPSIRQDMQAVVDGEPLNIMNAESDSQGITTRLAVRRYEA